MRRMNSCRLNSCSSRVSRASRISYLFPTNHDTDQTKKQSKSGGWTNKPQQHAAAEVCPPARVRIRAAKQAALGRCKERVLSAGDLPAASAWPTRHCSARTGGCGHGARECVPAKAAAQGRLRTPGSSATAGRRKFLLPRNTDSFDARAVNTGRAWRANSCMSATLFVHVSA
jgi:hypothetical protein